MLRRFPSWGALPTLIVLLSATLWGLAGLQTRAAEPADKETPADFPRELVAFEGSGDNPVFTAAGPGHWDAKIRERGWILREGGTWHLWYTGYDGSRTGTRQLGYATSPDGLKWTRHEGNPLLPGHWVEDMMVVKRGGTYYMFAEGKGDRAQLLTSPDRVHWRSEGTLDIRYVDGKPLSPGPFGTPTAWLENDTWHLFYERMDAGIWLARSRDLKVWTNVQDAPVLVPGPLQYDRAMIAVDQIIKHGEQYYAYYHGTGGPSATRIWNTDVARSADLVHWQKYCGNPIVADQSSGMVLFDGNESRLYTMHDAVNVYFSRGP